MFLDPFQYLRPIFFFQAYVYAFGAVMNYALKWDTMVSSHFGHILSALIVPVSFSGVSGI